MRMRRTRRHSPCALVDRADTETDQHQDHAQLKHLRRDRRHFSPQHHQKNPGHEQRRAYGPFPITLRATPPSRCYARPSGGWTAPRDDPARARVACRAMCPDRRSPRSLQAGLLLLCRKGANLSRYPAPHINLRGIRQSAFVINLLTVAKLVPLAVFIVVGFWFIDTSRLYTRWPCIPHPVVYRCSPADLRVRGLRCYRRASGRGHESAPALAVRLHCDDRRGHSDHRAGAVGGDGHAP